MLWILTTANTRFLWTVFKSPYLYCVVFPAPFFFFFVTPLIRYKKLSPPLSLALFFSAPRQGCVGSRSMRRPRNSWCHTFSTSWISSRTSRRRRGLQHCRRDVGRRCRMSAIIRSRRNKRTRTPWKRSRWASSRSLLRPMPHPPMGRLLQLASPSLPAFRLQKCLPSLRRPTWLVR